jgi:hypothetical protein
MKFLKCMNQVSSSGHVVNGIRHTPRKKGLIYSEDLNMN